MIFVISFDRDRVIFKKFPRIHIQDLRVCDREIRLLVTQKDMDYFPCFIYSSAGKQVTPFHHEFSFMLGDFRLEIWGSLIAYAEMRGSVHDPRQRKGHFPSRRFP